MELVFVIRVVIVPLKSGDEHGVLDAMRSIAGSFGEGVTQDASPYSKPSGSHMLHVRGRCDGDVALVVDGIVTRGGGTGWITSTSDLECSAIWAAREGEAPPFGRLTTWASVESFPASALVTSRPV